MRAQRGQAGSVLGDAHGPVPGAPQEAVDGRGGGAGLGLHHRQAGQVHALATVVPGKLGVDGGAAARVREIEGGAAVPGGERRKEVEPRPVGDTLRGQHLLDELPPGVEVAEPRGVVGGALLDGAATGPAGLDLEPALPRVLVPPSADLEPAAAAPGGQVVAGQVGSVEVQRGVGEVAGTGHLQHPGTRRELPEQSAQGVDRDQVLAVDAGQQLRARLQFVQGDGGQLVDRAAGEGGAHRAATVGAPVVGRAASLAPGRGGR